PTKRGRGLQLVSADHSDVMAIQKRLKSASAELNNPTSISFYAQARQVISYDSDRRKNLLARHIVAELGKGDVSHAEAETRARANPAYRAELEVQAEELQTAEAQIAKRRATEVSWESARSLLSFQREGFKRLPETEQ